MARHLELGLVLNSCWWGNAMREIGFGFEFCDWGPMGHEAWGIGFGFEFVLVGHAMREIGFGFEFCD